MVWSSVNGIKRNAMSWHQCVTTNRRKPAEPQRVIWPTPLLNNSEIDWMHRLPQWPATEDEYNGGIPCGGGSLPVGGAAAAPMGRLY